jgi:hypothetical protein
MFCQLQLLLERRRMDFGFTIRAIYTSIIRPLISVVLNALETEQLRALRARCWVSAYLIANLALEVL